MNLLRNPAKLLCKTTTKLISIDIVILFWLNRMIMQHNYFPPKLLVLAHKPQILISPILISAVYMLYSQIQIQLVCSCSAHTSSYGLLFDNELLLIMSSHYHPQPCIRTQYAVFRKCLSDLSKLKKIDSQFELFLSALHFIHLNYKWTNKITNTITNKDDNLVTCTSLMRYSRHKL